MKLLISRLGAAESIAALQGDNPAEAGVKTELDRVKEAMMRCKDIQDKAKRQRVDQGAAKRLVTSGLWKPGEEKIRYPSS